MDDGNEEQNKFFASIIKEKDMEEWKNWQTKDFLSTSPESPLEDSWQEFIMWHFNGMAEDYITKAIDQQQQKRRDNFESIDKELINPFSW